MTRLTMTVASASVETGRRRFAPFSVAQQPHARAVLTAAEAVQ